MGAKTTCNPGRRRRNVCYELQDQIQWRSRKWRWEDHLKVFFTPKRLIGLTQNDVNHICVDAPFKMIYPLLMIGTTDISKAYHPYELSLCLNETGDDYAFCFESMRKTVVIYLG